MEFTARFDPDRKAGGFVVTFPGLDYGVTQGETADEAMEMATDPLACTIGNLLQQDLELPHQRQYRARNYRNCRPAHFRWRRDLQAATDSRSARG